VNVNHKIFKDAFSSFQTTPHVENQNVFERISTRERHWLERKSKHWLGAQNGKILWRYFLVKLFV